MENSASPEILDLAVGIRRLAGDRELYKQIMEIFFSEAEEQLQTLQQALDSQDAELIKRVSHSMKGAAANLGALRVQDTAFKLEMIGTEEVLDNASVVYAQLKKDVEEVSAYWKVESAKMTD